MDRSHRATVLAILAVLLLLGAVGVAWLVLAGPPGDARVARAAWLALPLALPGALLLVLARLSAARGELEAVRATLDEADAQALVERFARERGAPRGARPSGNEAIVLALGALLGGSYALARASAAPSTALALALLALVPGALLVVARRARETRALVAWLRERSLPAHVRALEQCVEACRSAVRAATRAKRAREGLAHIERIDALDPAHLKNQGELVLRFRAVAACAEVAALCQKAAAAKSERARQRHLDAARELVRERAIDDDMLRAADVLDPATARPLTLAALAPPTPPPLAPPAPARPPAREPVAPPRAKEAPAREAPARAPVAPPPAPVAPPPGAAPGRWIASGTRVEVAGRALQGGLFYLGSALAPVGRARGIEPALVDPALEVADGGRGVAAELAGASGYAELSPAARGRYLAWLASGRSDPRAPAGCARLFLFGLERRVLHDGAASPLAARELELIRDEARRLAELHAQDAEVADALARLAELVELALFARAPLERARAEASAPRAAARQVERVDVARAPRAEPQAEEVLGQGVGVPTRLVLVLGKRAAAGVPLPAEEAFAWLAASPDVKWRASARRCPAELRELFLVRYRERFGDGLALGANKTRARLAHVPASPSFARTPVELALDLPDPTALTKPLAALAALAETCSDELDPYSRWLARQAGEQSGLVAAALLPPAVESALARDDVRALAARLDELVGDAREASVDAAALVAAWPSAKGEALTRAESVQLASVLARLGFGLEPDVRFGGPPLVATRGACVFRVEPSAPAAPSEAYAAAALVVHLAAAVATAGGDAGPDEVRALEGHIATALALEPAEERRLVAHLAWLLERPPGLAGVRRKLDGLAADERERIARFLVELACADGHADPSELATLTQIYELLGLEPGRVHSDVHRFALAGEAEPERVSTGAAPLIDSAIVARKTAETHAVSRLLHGIFQAEDEAPRARTPPPAAPPHAGDAESIAGLDAAHSLLLRELVQRESWSRREFDALSSRFDLLPAGALEVLNEAAFERCGAPLCEGDDPLELDPVTREELLS